MEESYYFEENRNAFTVDMLDKPMGNSEHSSTLREFLNFYIDEGFIDYTKEELDTLTTEQLSHAVDRIDYLETK